MLPKCGCSSIIVPVGGSLWPIISIRGQQPLLTGIFFFFNFKEFWLHRHFKNHTTAAYSLSFIRTNTRLRYVYASDVRWGSFSKNSFKAVNFRVILPTIKQAKRPVWLLAKKKKKKQKHNLPGVGKYLNSNSRLFTN